MDGIVQLSLSLPRGDLVDQPHSGFCGVQKGWGCSTDTACLPACLPARAPAERLRPWMLDNDALEPFAAAELSLVGYEVVMAGSASQYTTGRVRESLFTHRPIVGQ